jgi:hypothetical protein
MGEYLVYHEKGFTTETRRNTEIRRFEPQRAQRTQRKRGEE